MQLGLRLPGFLGLTSNAGGRRAISWRSLRGGGLVATGTIVALSTQFLFQPELYDVWPWADILRGWLDYLVDLSTVGGCIFASVAVAALLRVRRPALAHLLVVISIAAGALAGEAFL